MPKPEDRDDLPNFDVDELDDGTPSDTDDSDADDGLPSDDDGEDPDSGEEGDEDEGEEVDLSTQRRDQRPPRSERRIQALAEENRRKDQQLSDLNRRIDELTRTQSAPHQEDPNERAARRALMSVEERLVEDQREATVKHETQMRGLAFQLAETSDRTSFEAWLARPGKVSKWASKNRDLIDTRLAEIRSKGQNIERRLLALFLLGESIEKAENSPENRRERRAAAARVRRANVRPSNSRSDESPRQESRRQTSLEKRLDGQLI